MHSIIYIIPYFGKLPNNFQLWLNSCSFNKTINWLIFTDDKTEYNYPENVKVVYDTFDKIKELFQSKYDFEININRPWKLCDYKVAYGDIFAEHIAGYDFWGFCDIDLFWGNIRKFLTEELLSAYDKIGFQGHSTLIKNTLDNNTLYKKQVEGCDNYKEVFSSEKGYCFDEWTITKIFKKLNKNVYEVVNFAHLNKYTSNFQLVHLEENVKNYYCQIFEWKNGEIKRYYVEENTLLSDEFMYIHLWCRPITYKVNNIDTDHLLIYPDIITDNYKSINLKFVKNKGKKHPISFLLKAFWVNRKKISLKKIINNLINKRKLKKYMEQKNG